MGLRNMHKMVLRDTLEQQLGDTMDSEIDMRVEQVEQEQMDNSLYFKQPLSHFTTELIGNYYQRYMVQKSSSPSKFAIIDVTGEWKMVFNSKSDTVETRLARELNADLYGLSHRGYETNDTVPVRYVSVDESVEDLANFASTMDPTKKWILIGCSYAGTMVHFAMAKYANLFHAGWACSAPLLVKENFFEYDQMLFTVLGQECGTKVHLATKYIDDAFTYNKTLYNEIKVGVLQENATLYSDQDFITNPGSRIAVNVQFSYGKPNPFFKELCKDENNDKSTFKVTKFIPHYLHTIFYYFKDESLTSNGDDPAGPYEYNWYYQVCSDFGWFQVASKQHNIFSKYLTLANYKAVDCAPYNFLFKNGKLAKELPRTASMNLRFATTSKLPKVLYTHGELDPWSSLGHKAKQLNIIVPFNNKCGAYGYTLEYGSHCNDYKIYDDYDLPNKARNDVLQTLIMLATEC